MDVQVKGVAPATYRLLSSGLAFGAVLKKQFADGWQADQDVPEILRAAIGNLAPAVQSVHLVAEEFKQSPEAATKAVVLALFEAYGLLK